jgi:hypothetical protein
MMLTHKDAKTMARSLRDALDNRNVQLSHSDCLEIVARQFGLADWNTLVAKLPTEEERHARPRDLDAVLPPEIPIGTPSSAAENGSAAESTSATSLRTSTPWGPCSFCGKSAPEVRILLGGCGGWEGFRARRNPESGERSNAFICNECIALTARIVTGTVGTDMESPAT